MTVATQPRLAPPDTPEGVTHIIEHADDDRGASQIVREAIRDGVELVALCGYRWVPRLAPQPDDLPLCRPCVKAAEARDG